MKTTMHDIVDTAAAAGTFKTLVAAIIAADLGAAFKGAGPFTIFAPDDEAFAKLAPGVVEDLLRPERKAMLAAILKLHVVPGMILMGEVAEKKLSPASLNGEDLHIDGGKGVTVNSARVVKPDIACTNGVIHGIDRVLLPKPTAAAKAG